jgi:hypothetical protein
MKNKLLALMLGLLLAVAATQASAQTIGGDTSLSSKTWTWTGLTADLPETVLFTPTQTSDFLLSGYVTVSGGECAVVTIFWTDEYGRQVYQFQFQGGSEVAASGQGSTMTIHAIANTSVSVSTNTEAGGCGSSGGTYDLVIGKMKINP